MSNRQLPFLPVGAPQPQYQAPPQQPQYASPGPVQYTPPQGLPIGYELWCACCEGEIEFGCTVVELFIGEAGVNSQTGFPAAVVPANEKPRTEIVHAECLVDYVMKDLCPDQAQEMFWNAVEETAEEEVQERLKEMKREDALLTRRLEDNGS